LTQQTGYSPRPPTFMLVHSWR